MKKPLTNEEQVAYIKKNKRIVCDNEEAAKNFLLKYKYINVITPYKLSFCIGRDKDNKHIYNESNFSE